MDKPVVRYSGKGVVGFHGRAVLQPLDHPNHIDGHAVTNTRPVITSRVISWDKTTGRIETANTVYVPEVAPS